MDLQALLASHGDDAPSGENLEYDMDFINLELAAAPGEERQAGDEILPAEDPDWGDVKEKALTVMERSHDLRAANYLAQAILHTDGLSGFVEVTAYIRGCLEDFWDTCHPELDAEDDNDPTARINAMQALGAPEAVVRSLRQTPLTESRGFGRFGLRELQYASGESQPPKDATVPDGGEISAAFQDSDQAVLAEKLAAAREALANVKAIEAKFAEETPGRGPNLDLLIKTLQQIINALNDNVAAPEAAEDAGGDAEGFDAAAEGEGGAAPAAGGGGGGGVGAINSPGDVTKTLDKLLAYYERAEPSSPVPIILKRAKRLVGADFMTIIKDLAPQGMDSVTMIGGEDG
ncbi:type VI secretion system protein TssA [Frigidibacter sp. ROC022]|uniref:type VI secretion system protein TssA n=1 Tax=Frigidibacter sp. ROC022 TaxID=2971796 RepID=UPI00215AEA2F|nr:type VI secretion system protein TssA [Frigidibacter sp. ROC022]MCR8723323.1 type VI secretion system protein TssA [Frigidibacter sp. ROC022]